MTTFYSGSTVYAPEIEYTEIRPTVGYDAEESSLRAIEWRPAHWLSRAAATAAVVGILSGPLLANAASRPTVTINKSSRPTERDVRSGPLTAAHKAAAARYSGLFRQAEELRPAEDFDVDYGL